MPTLTKTKIKTSTIVGIALGVALFGTVGFSAGIYFCSSDHGNSAGCSCPVCPKCGTADNSGDNSDNGGSGDNQGGGGNNIDLAITKTTGATGICGVCSNVPWTTTITIKNLGSNAAGAFTVKIYRGSSAATDKLLRSVDVSGLAAGESTAVSATVPLNISTHTDGAVTMVAVSNTADTDTNLSNNTARRYVTGN